MPEGKLSIEAGTRVAFASSDASMAHPGMYGQPNTSSIATELVVRGTLELLGTASEPVVFNGESSGAESWGGGPAGGNDDEPT